MIKECMKMAWSNVVNNRMRSFLTTLGIVIGIASIIALITVVEGVNHEMMKQFESLGAGNVIITAQGTPLKMGLNERELDELSAIDHVSGVSPSLSGKSSLEWNGKVEEDVTIYGRNDVYFFQKNDTLKLGRGLSPLDMSANSYVCLINETGVKTLFPGEDPLDQKVKIGGRQYTVIGVMKDEDSLMASFSGSSGDDEVMVTIPYKNAMRLLRVSSVVGLEVYMSDTAYSNEVIAQIEGVLDQAFNDKDDSYSIINMDSLLETMETMQNMLTLMLGGIASISLLVGGIGIMNMMLTSVSERTKEIGLRKALGAEPGQIQLQFIVESIFLSILGGAIGVILGLALSVIVSVLIGMEFVASTFAVALGVGFSAGVGILFGWAPSRKASRLNPIDALRSE